MLSLIFTIVVLVLILIAEEVAWKRRILHDEYQRKFIHMATGAFMAFWPWIINWTEIEILTAVGVTSALVYKRVNIFSGLGAIRSNGYGHITHPLAVLITASLTHQKIFFCLAVLNMALADGMAAIIGNWFGKNWRYKVFDQTKTVLGTMAFWLTSMLIFGVGALFIKDQISFANYCLLLILAPPALALIENLGVFGFDNVMIPLAVLLALNLAS